MARLAEHCRKQAIGLPCSKQATTAADKDCAGLTGYPRGNCMTARFEAYLAEYCADIVCPNDPNRYAAEGVATSVQTTAARADEGGGFDKLLDQFNVQQQGQPGGGGSSSGGQDVAKVRMYILGGIAALAVVIVATSLRKR